MAFKDIEKSLRAAEIASARRSRKREGESEKERRELENYRNAQNLLFSEKLRLAKQILSWTGDFAKSDTYRRIKRVYDGPRWGVEIYGGGWGHTNVSGDGFGCWSRVLVGDDGAIQYEYGYKNHGLSGIDFDSEKSLARGLDFAYLSKLSRHLNSSGVVEHLKSHLKRAARE